MSHHVSVLEIDGKALAYNLNYFKKKLKSDTKVLAVVKAFGYGSDGVQVAQFLQDKVDYFGVAYTQEGIALREAGVQNPILVLHPQLQNLEKIIDYCLEPNLYHFKIFDAFSTLCATKQLNNYPVHLKINTGLNRLGFTPEEALDLIPKLIGNKAVRIASVFSHLAASEDKNATDFTNSQIEKFRSTAEKLTKVLHQRPIWHILNTSGVINYPNAQFDMVRIGIGLYGFGNDDEETAQLKNTHNLRSIISQIHTIAPGDSVGYNFGFRATKPTRSATIPIGHADGIPRGLGKGKGAVYINQQKAPILGNVCMDMIMVDVTNIECKVGDEVVIFNNQQMILDFAKACDSIPYETLTNISARIQKILVY